MKPRVLWCAAVAVVAALGAVPAVSQEFDLRILPPPVLQADTGAYRFQWEDLPPGVSTDRSVFYTWYYAKKANGADKLRMVTTRHDDFADFAERWNCPGVAINPWKRLGGVLRGPADAAPLFSNYTIPADSVVSLKVRSAVGPPTWGVQLGVQKSGNSLEFRHDGNRLKILEAGQQIDAFNIGLAPDWYWYEIGLLNKKGRDVQISLRILNEDRTRLMANRTFTHKLTALSLKKDGGIALSGPANFAELYVDPWSSHSADDPNNVLTWDTSAVPNGKYHLIAEVTDGRNPPRLVSSDFLVDVRNK